MKMTNKQFIKEICLSKTIQTKILLGSSINYYLYIISLGEINDSPFTIQKSCKKFVDLFDLSTEKKAERALKHLESHKDKVWASLSLLESKVANIQNKIKSEKSKNKKEIKTKIGDDFTSQRLKWETECMNRDMKDLRRINTIDISDSFSFRRIAMFCSRIWELYNNLAVSSKELKERIDEFHILEEYENVLRDKNNQLIGYWSARTGIDLDKSLKDLRTKRTKISIETGRKKRKIKKR